jgi:arsenite-transporting ATPase
MKIYFFLGKGGVGKSTISSLTAVYLAGQGKKVVLTSLDPAHNLTDIFERGFSDKATNILTNLDVIETDHDKWIRAFVKQSENQLKSSYSYLTTFSMEKHFSVLQHAPALEEYALHMAFASIVEDYKALDFLIFDMPPTALALKFFALPQLSLLWLENLLHLRSEIIDKQKIITRLSLGNKTFERDRVTQNINTQQKNWRNIDTLLKNNMLCFPVVVENPDQLSTAESQRIISKMKNMAVPSVVRALNKASAENPAYQLVIQKKEKINGMDNLLEAVKTIDFSRMLTV